MQYPLKVKSKDIFVTATEFFMVKLPTFGNSKKEKDANWYINQVFRLRMH